MSNLIFPSSLKGFDIKVSRSPVYGTLVQTSASGKELRASFEAWPRYRYTLNLNFAREAGYSAKTVQDETANLNRFFQIHLGSWDSFLFQDPLDYTVTGMGFGLGDGTTTAFQLQRVLAGQITDGLGTYPAYSTPRTNLVTYSQAFDNAAWIAASCAATANAAIAPDGTATAESLVEASSGSTEHYVNQSFSSSSGQTASVSIYAKAGARSWCYLGMVLKDGSTVAGAFFNLATGTLGTVLGGYTATITAVSNGWYRLTLTGSVGTGTSNTYLRFQMSTADTVKLYAGDGVSNIYAWGAQAEIGSSATRYIPTTSAAGTVNPTFYPASGDGFEPVFELGGNAPTVYRTDWQGTQQLYQTSRTNLLKYSQDLTQASAWTPNSSTATGGQASPDGGTGGTLLTATGSGGNFIQNITAPSSGAYTMTVYAKAGVSTIQRLLIRDGTTATALASANFNLSTGAIALLVGTTVASMQAVGGGYYRLQISTGTLSATAGDTLQAYVYAGQGTTGDTATVFGVQLEQGSVSTSYIPTTTAPASRTDYTLSSTGLVTLAQAPVSGAYLTWTGTYYRRVRFDGDSIELERMVSGAWDGKTVKLITVK